MANTTKKFKVLNPRNIPAGVNVLRFGSKGEPANDETDVMAFEGDELVPPIALTAAKDLVAKGFLEEITNG
jgi:hypothetical protein